MAIQMSGKECQPRLECTTIYAVDPTSTSLENRSVDVLDQNLGKA